MIVAMSQSQSKDSPGSFSESQIRILLSAEKMFAQNGIDGASLREIAKLADQRNPFAPQYHFGSREGLMRAVFAFRMGQLEEERARMLAEAEAAGREHEPRVILDMIYLPQITLVDGDGNHSYANFLCQYLLRERATWFGDFGTPLPPTLVRILELLRGCMTHLSDAAAQRRLVSSSLVFLHFLSVYGGMRDGQEGGETFEERLWDTLGQIEKATLMPLSGPRVSAS
ncbi:MAG: TetR/AcrR family transcriptional regulator [Novosphingobium sp.]|jgi:AcrR family transcriptional regulator